ncbi:MAG: pilus assembly protein [Hespellia sp.]|nr:pilus assembly protein [Hespellia sp.]
MTRYNIEFMIRKVEKVSAWTKRASVTVEAALALPLFFFAALLLIYQLEIRAVNVVVEAGANSAVKIAAKEMYLLPVLNPMQMESDMVTAIGNERLERSIVEEGSSGLNCSGSYASPQSGIIHMKVSYRIKLPFPAFAVPPVKVKQEFQIKGWTGYEKEGFGDGNAQVVYITDHAAVYHKDYHCTHLQLSVHRVLASEVGGLRNENGGKYHACVFCGHGAANAVYITDEGDCYHTRAGCSGLKRTIYAVSLSQVKGKGACSRCGQSMNYVQ